MGCCLAAKHRIGSPPRADTPRNLAVYRNRRLVRPCATKQADIHNPTLIEMSASPTPVAMDEAEQQTFFGKSGAVLGKGGAVLGKGGRVAGDAVWGLGKAFTAFIRRGNIVDMATGIVMGAAFTAVVNSFVSDLIMPFVALGGSAQFQDLHIQLRSPNPQSCAASNIDCRNIHTIAQLAAAGGISLNYGRFIQLCVTFLLTATIVFGFVQSYSTVFLRVAPVLVKRPPPTKVCEKCTEKIPIMASRCKFCTWDQVELARPSEVVVETRKGFFKKTTGL
ncbi:hypothetical protein SeMB42_g00162 [Synchytrium endobioticum]|uniref:Large conductance mechanosensitive channel protein n=1 Tax=Synchytrium endobioticum TaxID=286115 RepID=A0A507DSD2_9FUNG|nr:hypothetical protein SeMB42_g00162 [Synchytrium endobioticum]